ncbi:ATP-binding cassette domain-containing protein [Paenibacillus hamazuiensis]|uniref:ATP-binding cassette domain-containing protein n=1 Tax=Paenibacillus hamazuiensis TaxID=2936508 RepID=UPI0030843074
MYENFMVTHFDGPDFKDGNWRRKAKTFARQSLDEVFPDHRIDVSKTVEHYSLAERQMIEIARAMSTHNLKVLILDEPTSSLTMDRIKQLHDYMRHLCGKGVSIIYVSHKLEEIKQVSNRVVLMKNGEQTWEGQSAEISTADLIKHLGGNVSEKGRITRETSKSAEQVIAVNHLDTRHLREVNMEVRQGEIVGIAGLEGSGQKQLLNELYNAAMGRKRTGIQINKSVAFISGDRQTEGIFHLWDISDNMLISGLQQVTRWGIIQRDKAEALAQEWFQKLKFKAESKHAAITALSGGNQQKALIARGIASQADIILLDDPTRGVDIETKQEIYRLLHEAKASGKSIVLYSTEDAEMEQCDRVYVMRSGRVVRELVDSDITPGNIVQASFEESKENGSISKTAVRDVNDKAAFHFLKELGGSRSTLPLVTLLVLLGLNAAFNINTVSYMGINLLVGAAIPLVFAALAQMFITLAGDIDLGIGSALGLANVLAATLLADNPVIGIAACILLTGAYAAMGTLIHIRKIPSIVVTLGTSFLWLGIALLIQPTPGGTAPEWLTGLFSLPVPVVPMPACICIVAAAATFWIVKRSRYGVILRGFGNHPEAVSHAGWSHLGARVTLYTMAGVCVILAGLAATAISHGSDVNASSTFTLTSIATIILGGCAFAGGIVEPIGVVGGAVAISLISSLLVFSSISTDFQSAAVGIVLLAALAANLVIRKRVS